MPSEIGMLSTQLPTIAYARLLREMHRLVGEGKGDSDEAELVADAMEAPWYAMTSQEQTRMRGLATDLNALKEGCPKRVEMNPQELGHWQSLAKKIFIGGEVGDVDTALNFLRQPVPGGLPRYVTPFLQSRCWDKLGDLIGVRVGVILEGGRVVGGRAISKPIQMRIERVHEAVAA
jgi:hypothetical protein